MFERYDYECNPPQSSPPASAGRSLLCRGSCKVRSVDAAVCVFVCVCERDRGREQSQVNLRVDFAGFPRVQDPVVHQGYSVCSTLPRKFDYLYKQESLGKQNKTAILFAVREFCWRTWQWALAECARVFLGVVKVDVCLWLSIKVARIIISYLWPFLWVVQFWKLKSGNLQRI